jgi:hypothetical protein
MRPGDFTNFEYFTDYAMRYKGGNTVTICWLHPSHGCWWPYYYTISRHD